MKTANKTELSFFKKFGMTIEESDNLYYEMIDDVLDRGDEWSPIYDIYYSVRRLSVSEAASKPFLVVVSCGGAEDYKREVASFSEYKLAVSNGIGYFLGINDLEGNSIEEPYMFEDEEQYND